jgi:hypothetical protein
MEAVDTQLGIAPDGFRLKLAAPKPKPKKSKKRPADDMLDGDTDEDDERSPDATVGVAKGVNVGRRRASQAKRGSSGVNYGLTPTVVSEAASSTLPKLRVVKAEEEHQKLHAAKTEEELSYTFTLTCDGCGIDCTERSWCVVEQEEDYCGACHGGKGGVLQANGVTVEGLVEEKHAAPAVLQHKKAKVELFA